MQNSGKGNKYIDNSVEESSSDSTNESAELEFNREKRENFENLMSKSSTNLDGYWDKKNPFVRFVLALLGFVIIAGVLYFVMLINGS